MRAIDTAGNVGTQAEYCWSVLVKFDFAVRGDLSSPLYPGASAWLNLVFKNPSRRAIKITDVTTSVNAATNKPGCSGLENLLVTRGFTGPVTVPKNTTKSLSDLAVPLGQWPILTMPNLSTNQDACKGATFTFSFSRIGGEGMNVRLRAHRLLAITLLALGTIGVGTAMRLRAQRLLAITVLALGAIGMGTAAWAYFSTSGAGTASASVATLNAPTNVIATNTTGSNTVGVELDRCDGTRQRRGRRLLRAALPRCDLERRVWHLARRTDRRTTCNDTSVANGTYTYKVTAVFRSWSAQSGASNSVTVTVQTDTTAPTAAVTFPLTGTTYNAAGGSGAITGTSNDASGVQLVRVSIRQAGSGNYWNGSSYSAGTETFANATLGTPERHLDDVELCPDPSARRLLHGARAGEGHRRQRADRNDLRGDRDVLDRHDGAEHARSPWLLQTVTGRATRSSTMRTRRA